MIRSNSEKQSAPAWRRRLSAFAIWAAVSTVIFLLSFFYRYLEDLAHAKTGTFVTRLIEQATGVYAAALLFVLVVRFARRFRVSRTNWPRRAPAHLLGVIAFSALHTTMMALSRKAIFFLAGMGRYDYGIMPIRYVMEFANYALWYAVWVTLLHLFDHYRDSRERELRTAHLEAQLAQSQLQALQAQIHPRFLFNALNTISSVIYEDVRAADTMIARLSDFLRRTLSVSNSQEVPLREELDFLNLYLDVMRPRFDSRGFADDFSRKENDDLAKFASEEVGETSVGGRNFGRPDLHHDLRRAWPAAGAGPQRRDGRRRKRPERLARLRPRRRRNTLFAALAGQSR